jgi:hypothetical protein
VEFTAEMEEVCKEAASNPSHTHVAIYATGDDLEWDWAVARSYVEAADLRRDLTAPGYESTDGIIVNLLRYYPAK